MCVQLILENLSDHNYIELPRATNCGNQRGKELTFKHVEGDTFPVWRGHFTH